MAGEVKQAEEQLKGMWETTYNNLIRMAEQLKQTNTDAVAGFTITEKADALAEEVQGMYEMGEVETPYNEKELPQQIETYLTENYYPEISGDITNTYRVVCPAASHGASDPFANELFAGEAAADRDARGIVFRLIGDYDLEDLHLLFQYPSAEDFIEEEIHEGSQEERLGKLQSVMREFQADSEEMAVYIKELQDDLNHATEAYQAAFTQDTLLNEIEGVIINQ